MQCCICNVAYVVATNAATCKASSASILFVSDVACTNAVLILHHLCVLVYPRKMGYQVLARLLIWGFSPFSPQFEVSRQKYEQASCTAITQQSCKLTCGNE